MTEWHTAVETGRIDKVKEMLVAGQAVEEEDSDGWTALQLAVSEGHVEVVRLLIEHGADACGVIS